MDVHVVGQNSDKPEYTDVILVAAKNDVVESTVRLLKLAKLTRELLIWIFSHSKIRMK